MQAKAAAAAARLAAREGLQRARAERLACGRQALHAQHEVHVDGADHQQRPAGRGGRGLREGRATRLKNISKMAALWNTSGWGTLSESLTPPKQRLCNVKERT